MLMVIELGKGAKKEGKSVVFYHTPLGPPLFFQEKINFTLQTMQMALPDDQILNQSKLCHLVTKYATNTSGAISWPNLQLMQVAPSVGQICN